MSYIDEAKLRNRHMMEQYKAHLRQQYSGKPVNNEAGLSMLRRLEENLSVARIREENVSYGNMKMCTLLYVAMVSSVTFSSVSVTFSQKMFKRS